MSLAFKYFLHDLGAYIFNTVKYEWVYIGEHLREHAVAEGIGYLYSKVVVESLGLHPGAQEILVHVVEYALGAYVLQYLKHIDGVVGPPGVSIIMGTHAFVNFKRFCHTRLFRPDRLRKMRLREPRSEQKKGPGIKRPAFSEAYTRPSRPSNQ